MTKHDPNEAIRLMEKEPVAKSDYKTMDKNWISPTIPSAPRTLNIKWRKLTSTATLPAASRPGDIGFDVCCDQDFTLPRGSTLKISTGIQLADMPTMDNERNRIFIKVEGRSGLSAKGIFPIGGIVDPTYRGEVFIVLTNNGPEDAAFTRGNKIAQFVVYKVATAGEVLMETSETITETVRGDKGFGSSGR